ncbi:NTP transferase domain-containing protein [Vibrio campbellii]|uniref:nucleotidyltransferase family protein n=1 Tax=Vibrio campbellii TaxID=680 RepID=UPI00210CBB1B|nr:nucleotidyltransferase family protein [Vibrio campbellii]UTZ36296.1 NTP transferase domain-containing protein [Vibrio campbellii]
MNHTIVYNKSLSLKEVVKVLDDGGIGLVSFVDKDGKLVGILTDGDLRRGILNSVSDIDELVNFKPIKMHVSSSKGDILARLKNLHRRHMPLVDENGVLVSVFTLDDVEFVSRPNTVVIMAGGLGSRLGELTKDTPKPMLHVGDKPMLQHLIEQFREQGFRKFILCLNYKKEKIQDFFKNGEEFSVDIEYITESKRMGTAGALSLINKGLNEPFIVVNADVLTNMKFGDFLDFHQQSTALASMVVRRYEQIIPFGVVNSSKGGNILNIEEKPSVSFEVNAGIYALDPIILNEIPKNEFFDMPSLFKKLIENKLTCSSYKVNDYWIDIGRKEELEKANEDIMFKF